MTNRAEKIRTIYAIILSVFIGAVGIALVCVAADIYYSGEGPGLIYSREIVGDRLKKLAIPLICLLAAIIAGAIFPAFETKAKRTSEATLQKLKRRMPAGGSGEEFERARKAYHNETVLKIFAWCLALVLALICAIVSLVYLSKTAHFREGDLSRQILNMVKTVLPCTAVSVLAFVGASVVNGVCSQEQVKQLKIMIKCGSREIALPAEIEILDRVKKVASHDITLWAVRGVVFLIAVAFIIAGVLNGGARDVLVKAINICTECIGIG